MIEMDLSEHSRLEINEVSLPPMFENEIVENGDAITIRSNIKSMKEINHWVKEFGVRTNTKWNCRKSCPVGERFICWKKFVCHHSSFNKVPSTDNKKGKSKNTECPATVTVKIKLNTSHTRHIDMFIKRGLVGIITIMPFHKHSLTTAETLRFLPAEEDCRLTFEDYFNNGMGVAESARYHKEILEMKSDFLPSDLENSRINPTGRTIRNWYDKWRLLKPQNGHGMIKKSKEKIATNGSCIVKVDRITPSSSESLAITHSTENTILGDNICRKKELCERLIELFGNCLEKFNASETVLENAVKCLERITSEGQWETMLSTLGINIHLKEESGITVTVQPT